jgi:penicillin-binding protein 1A
VQVLDSLVARIMVSLLEDAANRGTAGGHRTVGGLPYEVATAGKTGTTNDGTDVWFTGFTPSLLASVWFGFDRPTPIVRSANGATGGMYAAPVWGRFMRQVYYGLEGTDSEEAHGSLPIPEPWPLSLGLTTREIDRTTGNLWSSACSAQENRYVEIFIPGTEPTQYCSDAGSTTPRPSRPPR